MACCCVQESADRARTAIDFFVCERVFHEVESYPLLFWIQSAKSSEKKGGGLLVAEGHERSLARLKKKRGGGSVRCFPKEDATGVFSFLVQRGEGLYSCY